MPRRVVKINLKTGKKTYRNVKTKGLTKTQVKSVTRIAKKVALTVPEKKTFGYQRENLQLLHNQPQYISNFLSCQQGVEDPNDLTGVTARLGDEIYLQNINVRLWLSNKLDRPNVMYKCFLFWYESGITLSNAICFFTQTNKMLDRINNEQISMIDQKTIFSRANYSIPPNEREHSYLCTLNGNWKGKKITYDEGGAVPKKRTIGVAVVCYDAFGTLQSDNIASFAYNAAVRFRDP